MRNIQNVFLFCFWESFLFIIEKGMLFFCFLLSLYNNIHLPFRQIRIEQGNSFVTYLMEIHFFRHSFLFTSKFPIFFHSKLSPHNKIVYSFHYDTALTFVIPGIFSIWLSSTPWSTFCFKSSMKFRFPSSPSRVFVFPISIS